MSHQDIVDAVMPTVKKAYEQGFRDCLTMIRFAIDRYGDAETIKMIKSGLINENFADGVEHGVEK